MALITQIPGQLGLLSQAQSAINPAHYQSLAQQLGGLGQFAPVVAGPESQAQLLAQQLGQGGFASASGQGAANAIGATASGGGGAAGGFDSGLGQISKFLGKERPKNLIGGGAKKFTEDAAAKKGLLSKFTGGGTLGSLFGPVEGATGLSAVQSGILGRVALPIGGAYAASGLGHMATLGQHKGNWDEGAEGALTGMTGGALAGATLGSPFFGIGAVPGALIGGAIGGLGGLGLGLFGPKNTGEKAVASETRKQSKKLNSFLDQFGASPEMKKQLGTQFLMAASTAGSKKDVKAKYTELASNPQLADMIAQDRRRGAANAAVQAWMGPALKDAIGQQQFYANAQGDAFDRIASQYTDPTQAATTRAYGANARSSAAERSAAMMQQLALSGQLAGLGMQTSQNQDGTDANDLQSLLAAQPVA